MARFARSGIVAIGLLVCSIGGGAQTQTSSTLSPDLTKLLQQIKAADTDLLAVSEEDGRFLRGKGNYVDDITLPDMLHLELLRSPYAHAHIKGIETAAARQQEGVIAVVTGPELAKVITRT